MKCKYYKKGICLKDGGQCVIELLGKTDYENCDEFDSVPGPEGAR